MPRRNAISTDGRSSRFLVAVAIIALLGLLPFTTVAASLGGPSPSTATAASADEPATSADPAIEPAAPPKPAALPNPDQVPLVAVTASGTGARLVISAPKQVAVGQTITIAIKAIGVKNLAGYEGVLRFDPAAAEFDGLSQRSVALAGLGRDVEPLGPVVIPSGVAFGLYSCSLVGCGGTQSTKTHAGATGSVSLAKLTLVPTVAGRLAIALGSMRFVDAGGKLMTIALPRTISVQVGAGSTAYAAPLAPTLRPSPAHAVTSADISGDGFVGPADLNIATIAWGLAREAGNSCGLVNEPADVNHDGCLDVQDLQLIAARVAPRPAPLASHLAEPLVALDLTVDSTSDAPDAKPGDGICATAAAVCSLRAAITEANLHPGPDTILFNIPGAGVHTITLGGTLPIISDTTGGVTIDGYSQPGASPNTDPVIDNAQLMIQLTSAPNPNLDAIFVSSANNEIRGLSMYNFRRSISFETSSAHDNSVIGSFIGTNAAGAYFSPTFVSGGNGINVTTGASYTTVGGTDPASRDVLTGNSANGFSTYNEQSDHNTVYGNLIGLAPNGQSIRTCSLQCYGNIAHGVDINSGSSYNLIGGTGTGQRNVISNNHGEGIEFSHGSTTDSNQAVGNYIGTDVTGNAGAANKFGNGLNGVHLQDAVTDDTVAFNVVVNNGQRGDGSEVMGGIGVEGFYAAGASIHDNMIGVGRDGVTPLPNKFFGVDIHFNASWMTVGPNNVIANNPSGVIVSDASDVFNTITHNSIYNNGSGKTGRGIQLLNHSNHSVAPPVLGPTGVSLTAATGTACAGCTVEAFLAAPDAADASAGLAGQGKVFLGSTIVPASGAFTVGLKPTLTAGTKVTATVTDGAGETSQFSSNVAAAAIQAPTPPPTPVPTPKPTVTTYVADTFTRSLTSTWGRADIGGNYAGFYCTNVDMNVTGTAATVLVPDPHHPTSCTDPVTVNTDDRGGYLTNVSAENVDVRFRVSTATLATSDNINVGFDVRRVSGFTSYRGQVRLTPTNQVWLQADAVVHDNMTPLGTSLRAHAASVAANSFIWVRGQVTGTNPTTIKLKAWNDGTPEPSAWDYSTTDSTGVLQAPGAAGLLAWLSPAWNQGPITVSFDDFNVTSPISDTVPTAPIADFSAVQTSGTLAMKFTDTSTGGAPTSWWWDFGDGSGSTSQNPSHTYSAPGSYQVKLIATNNGGFTSKTSTVSVTPPPGPSSTYHTLAPARILDTRAGTGLAGRFVSTVPRSFAVAGAGGVPGNAVAVTGNLTVTGQTTGGYVSLTTSAQSHPATSTLNFPLGDSRANGVTVALASGHLWATYVGGTSATTNLVFDVTGYFTPDLKGDTYHTLAPARILDTRAGTGLAGRFVSTVPRSFAVAGAGGVPGNAVAVTGNLTVTGQTTGGYVSLTTSAQSHPATSTLNFPLGDSRANGVTVALASGHLWATYVGGASATTNLVFDVTGYFTPDLKGDTYHTLAPARILDTRAGTGLAGRFVSTVPRSFAVAGAGGVPGNAVAVTGNLTVTGQTTGGYVSLTTSAQSHPATSTLNFPLGDSRANGVTVALASGHLWATYVGGASATTNLVFDVTGYFAE